MACKWTTKWVHDRRKLKRIYENKGITTCELRLDGCAYDNMLSFAHRHKRRFYYSQPHLLGKFDQTLLACIPCHEKIENDKELTEYYFNLLR
jgi:hypothetical protein